jgi:hypothetical protein
MSVAKALCLLDQARGLCVGRARSPHPFALRDAAAAAAALGMCAAGSRDRLLVINPCRLVSLIDAPLRVSPAAGCTQGGHDVPQGPLASPPFRASNPCHTDRAALPHA